jgi:predicted kinase
VGVEEPHRPRLVHLNGAPGVGKTSLAKRWVDEHPLALLVDIDALRTALGGWREHDESRLVARDLALSLVETHLSAGHDVVVPQYLGRIAFVDALDALAARCGARFVEVVLDAPADVAAARFRSRRAELLEQAEDHPQLDVADEDVDAAVEEACAAIDRLAAVRPAAVRVPADRSAEETYAELLAAVEGG